LLDVYSKLLYNQDMSNNLTYGEKDILAEIEADARDAEELTDEEIEAAHEEARAAWLAECPKGGAA
jgi:hypothetical protein